jgi:hypothetical protein
LERMLFPLSRRYGGGELHLIEIFFLKDLSVAYARSVPLYWFLLGVAFCRSVCFFFS